MTFNTGNPIGSTDARDLSDNAENFDKALGTLDATWTDRLGVTRDSFEGRLAKGSFYRVGDFTTGYTLTNMRQTLEYNGHEYSWAGAFPKVVAAGATPETSGGIGAGAWIDRTDSTLRSFLASSLAASNIGTTKEISVEQRLLDIENSIPSQTPAFQQPSSLRESLASLLVYGIDNARNNILIIGDSITKNVGASNPKFSYAACLGKALANFYKKGYGYPLHLNISNAMDIVSYTGTVGQSGLGAESVTVSSSQALTICKSEAIAVAVVIDGPNSSCSTIELRINGVAVASAPKPTGNPGIAFLVSPYKEWESCDVVTISPVGGSMVVLGATPLKRGDYNNPGNTSPLIITCGASGQSFDYYTNNISQVGTLLNSLNADSPATCIIALGTNSIYNNTQAQTPSEYISSLTALIAAIAASATTNIVLTIPPKANETLWPVIKSGYTYDDYVAAIKSFASSTVYDVIDLNIPELPYVDGVHPNDAGHISIAKRYCDFLSISADFGLPQIKLTSFLSGASPVIITNGYVSVDRNGTVTLKGKVNPNGAGTNLLTTLPIVYRPSVMRKFVVPLDTNGFGIVTIDVNGEVRMAHSSITWTYAYLDGISF